MAAQIDLVEPAGPFRAAARQNGLSLMNYRRTGNHGLHGQHGSGLQDSPRAGSGHRKPDDTDLKKQCIRVVRGSRSQETVLAVLSVAKRQCHP